MAVQTNGELKRIIDPVSPRDLETAREEKKLDSGTRDLLEMESRYIANWRKESNRANESDTPRPENGAPTVDNLTGLAFSGGGIRSATFSLGIMQALAKNGLLDKFDYLSTVSGGGYIGSAVGWLTSEKSDQNRVRSDDHDRPEFGLKHDDFPFGTDDPSPDATQRASNNQRKMLRFLRGHGNYLSPGEGINIISLVAIVLRGMLLNLFVWLPIFALFLLPSFWVSENIFSNSGLGWLNPDAPWLAKLFSDASASGWSIRYLGFELLLRLAAGIICLLVAGLLLYSFGTYFRRGLTDVRKKQLYENRRYFESLAAMLIIGAGLLLVLGSIPAAASYVGFSSASAIIVGFAMNLPSFLSSMTSDKKVSPGILVPVGAAIFLYGVFVAAFQISAGVASGDSKLLIVLFLLSLLLGYWVNLNYISIHRFYRDRLMETFMPDIDQALENETGAAYGADCASIQDVANEDEPTGPYHIVNTNVVLVNSEEFVYKERGGDNFILSPLYCGSNATGWQRTDEYMDGKMTLATAVAISGAAANPNTGVGGNGITRNRILSIAMSLLNLRLGYWAHNPKESFSKVKNPPHHYRPGGYSFGNALAFGDTRALCRVLGLRNASSWLGFTENRSYLQLSDGGHFENTAVYELVRRRLKLILVCDGGADADFSFSDFQTTVRRIEDDFGARVTVDDGANPDDVLPVEPDDPKYPVGAKFSKQGYMTASIEYVDGSTGRIIYLKTSLIGGGVDNELSFRVKGYKAQHDTFPDESTSDQFFDEVQFEAYRELGYRIASQMIRDSDLKKQLS